MSYSAKASRCSVPAPELAIGAAACQHTTRESPLAAHVTGAPSSCTMCFCAPLGVKTRSRRSEVSAATKSDPAATLTARSPLGSATRHSGACAHDS